MADNIDPEKAKEAAASAEDLKQNLESLLKTIEGLNKGLKGLSDGTSEVRDNLAAASKTGEGFGDKLAGLAGVNSGFNKGIQNMVKGLGNADKMFAGFTKSLTANFNVMAVGISVMEKMFEATSALVMTTDAAFVSFQKQTGALSLYGSKIAALEQSTFNYGITIDEAADAQASLVMTIKNFNTLSDTSQERLLRTTAILNELGVESGLTAQSLNFMTNSLGMTADQADQTTREMFVLAKSMGMPPQEMAESFNAAAPQLAAFGNRATQVFQKLTVNARNANMEVADMLRIAEQFDRFDTAAAAVGKLNAALGGPYLSTIRMVTTTDPTERIRMMSDAARQAGKSFDSMDYFERKMIASAMGLKDVNELALVMRGRFDLVAGSVEQSAADIEKLAQQTKDYNTIMEEFSQLMRAFAINIAGPVIKGLKMFADGLTYIAQGPTVWVVAGIGMIIAATIAMMIAFAVATGGVSALISILVAFFIGAGAGVLMVLKGIYDVMLQSKPLMDKLTSAWTKITSKFEVFGKKAAPGASMMEQIVQGFDNFVKLHEKQIDETLDILVNSIVAIVDNLIEFNSLMSDSGAYRAFGFVIGMIAGSILALVSVIARGIEGFLMLTNFLVSMPTKAGKFISSINFIKEAFNSVSLAVTSMVDTIAEQYNRIPEIPTSLRVLFSSGLGPAAGIAVTNTVFNRQEDLQAANESMADAIGSAIKDAFNNSSINVNTSLEVASTGVAEWFDFFQRGMDDVASGRPPQLTANANRSGLGNKR